MSTNHKPPYRSIPPVKDLLANRDLNYVSLADVLGRAFEHAATGKGHIRHGSDKPFESQHAQQISALLDDSRGLAYQAIKKVVESHRLEPQAAVHELLGAINYLASMVIYIESTPT